MTPEKNQLWIDTKDEPPCYEPGKRNVFKIESVEPDGAVYMVGPVCCEDGSVTHLMAVCRDKDEFEKQWRFLRVARTK